MIPRHFNMHPQREVNGPRGKQHQMGLDDMRRFRQGLNESDNPEIMQNPKEYYEQREPDYDANEIQNGRQAKSNKN